MEWFDAQGVQGKVGLLYHFLEALGLPPGSAGKRAATFNAVLRRFGITGRLMQKKLRNRAGSALWVATREVYREIYKRL